MQRSSLMLGVAGSLSVSILLSMPRKYGCSGKDVVHGCWSQVAPVAEGIDRTVMVGAETTEQKSWLVSILQRSRRAQTVHETVDPVQSALGLQRGRKRKACVGQASRHVDAYTLFISQFNSKRFEGCKRGGRRGGSIRLVFCSVYLNPSFQYMQTCRQTHQHLIYKQVPV